MRDVEEIFRVASDLRFAIDNAFREAGIEIPFLQTDIHLRDMERLEAVLAGTGVSEQEAPAAGSPPKAGRRG